MENGMPQLSALFFASLGNILAIILNYFLGFWLYDKTKEKLHSSKIGRKSLYFGYKYGFISLFLTWIPIFGDPLTLVTGILRLRFISFLLIAGTLRILRYYALTFVL
ncbi:MAG: membrane protein YqaA with SNARE-associated domain [Sulfurimonas sp.]